MIQYSFPMHLFHKYTIFYKYRQSNNFYDQIQIPMINIISIALKHLQSNLFHLHHIKSSGRAKTNSNFVCLTILLILPFLCWSKWVLYEPKLLCHWLLRCRYSTFLCTLLSCRTTKKTILWWSSQRPTRHSIGPNSCPSYLVKS